MRETQHSHKQAHPEQVLNREHRKENPFPVRRGSSPQRKAEVLLFELEGKMGQTLVRWKGKTLR